MVSDRDPRFTSNFWKAMNDAMGSWDKHLLLAEFAYNNSYHSSIHMAPYEALYGRKCRSPLCWTELSERSIIGPDIVDQTTQKIEMIRQKLLTAQSRQKSYADRRRRPLTFEVGDHVFLKVSPMTGIGGVHDVFHVSQLKKYQPDPSHIIEPEEVELKENMTYRVEPKRIVDVREKQLRNKTIRLKVFWKGMAPGNATWETEEKMKHSYPHLFEQ
ncbi:uncharacterized protein LOC129299530, partial [Prosopis cineraria]|uniref:uncharacterized protein LOC129299530 n=1 Tax=Prosopis cineraria TaxID=364024 RepID=UPI0024101E56